MVGGSQPWRGPGAGRRPRGVCPHLAAQLLLTDHPATLFLQGTADQDIPAAWTNATLGALKAKGVDTSVTWYPGALHDMVGANLADADARAEAWIRQHLPAA